MAGDQAVLVEHRQRLLSQRAGLDGTDRQTVVLLVVGTKPVARRKQVACKRMTRGIRRSNPLMRPTPSEREKPPAPSHLRGIEIALLAVETHEHIHQKSFRAL
ncbi:hypothetical protein GCM10009642_48770 [Nocardiopsis metallicus]